MDNETDEKPTVVQQIIWGSLAGALAAFLIMVFIIVADIRL